MITTPIVFTNGGDFQASVLNGGVIPGTDIYTITGLKSVRSYRIDGCTGRISYAGNGLSGTFSVPYGITLAVSDTCTIDLFSVPASVVNAAPNYGFAYGIFYIASPVSQGMPPYPPAVDL
jgi:hypothetical protein